jgi:hypothetical protein
MPMPLSSLAQDNDAFRAGIRVSLATREPAHYRKHGHVLLTEAVHALRDSTAILGKAAHFADFPANDDPGNERNFGSFRHRGRRLFWKIEYYHALETPDASAQAAPPPIVWRELLVMEACNDPLSPDTFFQLGITHR